MQNYICVFIRGIIYDMYVLEGIMNLSDCDAQNEKRRKF